MLLGFTCLVSRVITRVTILITLIRGLTTLLITTLNPKPYNPIDPFKGTLLITLRITVIRGVITLPMNLQVGIRDQTLGFRGWGLRV